MKSTAYLLMACPFCGSLPTMHPWHGGGPNKRLIHCFDDICRVRPSVTGSTGKNAAAKWNARACKNDLYRIEVTEF